MRYSSVAVIGLSQTGLAMAMKFCQSGSTVYGIDSDESALRNIRNGHSHVPHIHDDLIKEYIQQSFFVSDDFEHLNQCDGIIISVPVGLDAQNGPDVMALNHAIKSAAQFCRTDATIVVESSTYPGYVKEEATRIIEEQGRRIGKDIYLSYSPNWDRFDTHYAPRPSKSRIVGAQTDTCMERSMALLRVVETNLIPVTSTTNAELAKVLEDTYRFVNFGLVNEIKMIADRLNADIHEVIRAMATKRDGCRPHFPGPGIGGQNMPMMPEYLNWKAKHLGLPSQFVQLAGQVNRNVTDWVVNKVAEALNDHKQSINGSRILVLGAAYRRNANDIARSPSISLMKTLCLKGAQVSYSDPWVHELKPLSFFGAGTKSLPLVPESISQFDLVLLATDHDDFDYDEILANSKLIVDTRGRFDSSLEKVVLA